MKIRTLLGLTIIGSAIYAHKRHGGEFTVVAMYAAFILFEVLHVEPLIALLPIAAVFFGIG